MSKGFFAELKEQRWDDHRYYHQSRINQTLHFVSALSFLFAYAMLFINPVVSAFVGWLVSMGTRQSGHFFFEPQGYDHVNHASNEYKEEIKVGYNLRRKVVLIAIWALCPVVLYFVPDLFGLVEPAANRQGFLEHLGWMWLCLGVSGLIFRTIHLFFIRGVQSGLVWMTKILTDPFHDLVLYWRSPLRLLRGELIDPMHHARQGA